MCQLSASMMGRSQDTPIGSCIMQLTQRERVLDALLSTLCARTS